MVGSSKTGWTWPGIVSRIRISSAYARWRMHIPVASSSHYYFNSSMELVKLYYIYTPNPHSVQVSFVSFHIHNTTNTTCITVSRPLLPSDGFQWHLGITVSRSDLLCVVTLVPQTTTLFLLYNTFNWPWTSPPHHGIPLMFCM